MPWRHGWLPGSRSKRISVDELGFAQADDAAIFQAARAAGAAVMTKDSDFADLVYRLGPPHRSFSLRSATAETPGSEKFWPKPSRRRWICSDPASLSSRSPSLGVGRVSHALPL
jgi:hypothetical protein